jgi:hypothetical protein
VLISNGSKLPPAADESATCDCATAALVIELRIAEDAAEEIAEVTEGLLEAADNSAADDSAEDDSTEDIATETAELLEAAAASATVVELSANDTAAEDISADDIANDMSVEETAATDVTIVVSVVIEEARVIIVDIGGKLIVE